MSSFSLDDLRQSLQSRFGPVELTGYPGGDGSVIRLLPILRHGADRRKEISEAMNRLGATQSDGRIDLNATVDSIAELLELVCERREDIHRIREGVNGDGQALLVLWEKYQEATQPGEAKPSRS